MGSAAIQSTFERGRKEGFCEKIEPKDSFNVCTKSSPTFSWNFLKAFSNSLETLADGSNDGAPKFRDCVENIKNNFFQHKKTPSNDSGEGRKFADKRRAASETRNQTSRI